MRFIPISGLLGMAVLVVSTTAWFVWGYPLQSSTAYASAVEQPSDCISTVRGH